MVARTKHNGDAFPLGTKRRDEKFGILVVFEAAGPADVARNNDCCRRLAYRSVAQDCSREPLGVRLPIFYKSMNAFMPGDGLSML